MLFISFLHNPRRAILTVYKQKQVHKDNANIWASKIYNSFTLDCLIILLYANYVDRPSLL
jgi:preprotein translocase subunit Sec63